MCPAGYWDIGQGNCEDIDECMDELANNCHAQAQCTNLAGDSSQTPNLVYLSNRWEYARRRSAPIKQAILHMRAGLVKLFSKEGYAP